MTGTVILDKIEHLLSKIDEIHSILFEDHSTIELGPYTILLGLYQILYKGKSWYNTLGYIHDNFDEQIKELEILRNETFSSSLEQIKNIFTYKKYLNLNYWEYYRKIFEIIAVKYNFDITEDIFPNIIEFTIEYCINEWY